jgi:hypothetical protein
MRRPGRALPLLAALGAACAGDPTAVTVRMTLDPDSCAAAQPGAVELRCDATAGAWLRGAAGDYLDRACVAFGAAAGEAPTLARLPSILAGVDLSTDSTDPVWLEVAVYGDWSEAQGCVAPDDLGGPGAQIVVRGRSGPVVLSESGGAIDVRLTCESIVNPPEVEGCEDECGELEAECLETIHVDECDEAAAECAETCEDQGCEEACLAGQRVCLAATPDGTCQLLFLDCSGACGIADFPCQVACEADRDGCLEAGCGGAFDECASACASGCAAVAG